MKQHLSLARACVAKVQEWWGWARGQEQGRCRVLTMVLIITVHSPCLAPLPMQCSAQACRGAYKGKAARQESCAEIVNTLQLQGQLHASKHKPVGTCAALCSQAARLAGGCYHSCRDHLLAHTVCINTQPP
jgi:hypothetical protein